MSNCCIGTMRVVAKDKNTLERLFKIMNYEDDEYCLYRLKSCDYCGKPYKDGEYWVQDFITDSAWSSDPLFTYGNREDVHLKGYEKKEDGTLDYNKEIEHKCHFTDLTHLAEELDFGAELFCCESGCEFCQFFGVNHDGELRHEDGEYHLIYPKDEDGEPNYDEEPDEEFGIDNYMEFGWANEIYGDI